MTPRTIAIGAAVAAGLAGWLVHPPWNMWLLAFTVPALLATALTAGDLPPWMVGAMSGLVTNLALLHWLRFRATVVAWVVLALIMAAWMALLAVLMARLLQRAWTVPLIPLVWVGIDAWRGSWPFGGFGWASLGISQVNNGWLVPVGRVLGEKGYTLFVVAISLAAWVAVRDALAARRGDLTPVVTGSVATETAGWPGRRPHTDPAGSNRADTGGGTTGPGQERAGERQDDAGGLLLLSAAGRRAASRMGDGAWLGTAMLVVTLLAVTLVTVGPPAQSGEVDVLAVQPNDIEVPNADYTTITREIATHAVTLTRDAVDEDGPADIVVWPEGTIGRDPARDPELAAAIREGAAITGGGLLVGTDLEDPDSDGYERVSLVVDGDGEVTDTYVKQRLVPFGEYVPLRWAFDWYPTLDQVSRDAIASPTAANVVVGTPSGQDVVVAVAICFETMFGDVVADNILSDGRAQLLVSSTSDATFGRSGQPDQHLDQVRMRAIETGRNAVHAAVSGTTAFVDQSGVVTAGATDLFTLTTVRHRVGLVEGLTPFLRMGDLLDLTKWLVVVVALGLVVVARRRPDVHHRTDEGAGHSLPPTDAAPANDEPGSTP